MSANVIQLIAKPAAARTRLDDLRIWYAFNQDRVELWQELITYFMLCALYGLLSGVAIGQCLTTLTKFLVS